MYWLRNTEVPNRATPTAMLATTARTSVRFLNRCSGMIGSLARDSTQIAAARASREPPTMAAVCHEAQSNEVPANVIHSSRVAMLTDRSVAPA